MKENKDGCPEFEESECDELNGIVTIGRGTANRLLKDWFEKQQIVYAANPDSNWHKATSTINTHVGRLIAVRPIEVDSFEKLARDLVDLGDRCKVQADLDGFWGAVARAKKLLEGKS